MQAAWNAHDTVNTTILHATAQKILCSFRSQIIFTPLLHLALPSFSFSLYIYYSVFSALCYTVPCELKYVYICGAAVVCLHCINCTRFGQLILRKIGLIKIVAKQISHFKSIIHQT